MGNGVTGDLRSADIIYKYLCRKGKCRNEGIWLVLGSLNILRSKIPELIIVYAVV
jgi:hypothetical protein